MMRFFGKSKVEQGTEFNEFLAKLEQEVAIRHVDEMAGFLKDICIPNALYNVHDRDDLDTLRNRISKFLTKLDAEMKSELSKYVIERGEEGD